MSAKIKVKLLKSHVHAGVKRNKDDTIEVSEKQRDWLEANKVIEPRALQPKPPSQGQKA